jgi:hypothetical protein
MYFSNDEVVVSYPQPGQPPRDEWKDYLSLQSFVQQLENLQKGIFPQCLEESVNDKTRAFIRQTILLHSVRQVKEEELGELQNMASRATTQFK